MSTQKPRRPLFGRSALALASLLALGPGIALPASAQTLERIKETGSLRLGYRSDARPFSWEEGGKATGYSIALCQRIAEAVKKDLALPDLEMEPVLVGNHERFLAVKQGRIDILCGASTVTLERRGEVAFSVPVFLGGIAALVRRDSPAQLRVSLAGQDPQYRGRDAFAQSLTGRNLTVRLGTTAEQWLERSLNDLGISANVSAIGLHSDGIKSLTAGESDVIFGDHPILLDEARRSPRSEELLILDRYFTYEAISLALTRGDEDFRLLIDRTLSRLYRTGEITAIYRSYFGEPSDTTLALFSRAALPE